MRFIFAALLVLLSLGQPCLAQRQTISYPVTPQIPPTTTVGSLPACTSALNGYVYVVTNALLPVLGAAVAGAGAVTVVVKCNGTLWLVGQ